MADMKVQLPPPQVITSPKSTPSPFDYPTEDMESSDEEEKEEKLPVPPLTDDDDVDNTDPERETFCTIFESLNIDFLYIDGFRSRDFNAGDLPYLVNAELNDLIPNEEQRGYLTDWIKESIPSAGTKRLAVVSTLVSQEYEYLKNLQKLEKVLRSKLLAITDTQLQILTKEETSKVFSNISEVFSVTQRFYDRLTDLKEQGPSELLSGVGQLFLEFTLQFNCYAKYSQSRNSAKSSAKKLYETNVKFIEFLKINSIHSLEAFRDLLSIPTSHLQLYIDLLKQLKYKAKLDVPQDIESKKLLQFDSFTCDMAIQKLDKLDNWELYSIYDKSYNHGRNSSRDFGDLEAEPLRFNPKIVIEQPEPPQLSAAESAEEETLADFLTGIGDDSDMEYEGDDEQDMSVARVPSISYERSSSCSVSSNVWRRQMKEPITIETIDEADEITQDQLQEAERILAVQKELPQLQQWVNKKSPNWTGRWQRRFLAIAEYNVFYGKKEYDVISAQFALDHGMNCIPLMLVNCIFEKDSRHFVIQSRDIHGSDNVRDYVFRTKTGKERDFWVIGLNMHKEHLENLLKCSAIGFHDLDPIDECQ